MTTFNIGDRVVITKAERFFGITNMLGVHGTVRLISSSMSKTAYYVEPDGGGNIVCTAEELRKE